MAGRISIRRKGGCFPAFCLLVLLAAVVLVTWLSTLGLPDSVLRRIERAAAGQGVFLRIGKIKLAPSSGLAVKAENLELRAAAGDGHPLATLDKAVVGMRIMNLLSGDFLPGSVSLVRGKVQLPVDNHPGEYLDINLSTLNARSRGKNVLRLSGAALQVEGISLKICGTFDLDGLLGGDPSPGGTTGPTDPAKFIASIQPQVQKAYHLIHSQQWGEDEAPALNIDINARKDLHATLHLTLPRYDIDLLHFRSGEAQLEFHNNTVVIHRLKFSTVEPASDVLLQGGYDTGSRLLSFHISSNAALIRMSERLVEDESLRGLLGKIRHADEDSPQIKLAGHLRFTENFEPEDIKVQGDLAQRRLSIGRSLIDNAELSFLYNNGDFHIHKCILSLPEGELKLTASLKHGEGKADFDADIDVARLLALVSEFTEEPVALPPELVLRGHTRLSIDATLHTAPFVPGKSSWEDLVPQLEVLELAVDVDQAAYKQLRLTRPGIAVTLAGIEQGPDMLPTFIREAELDVRSSHVQWQEEDPASCAGLGDFHFQLHGGDGVAFSNLGGESPGVDVRKGNASLNARKLGYGTMGAEELSVSISADKGFRLGSNPSGILPSVGVELCAKGMRDGDCDLGKAELHAAMDESRPDSASLAFTLTNAEGRALFLKTQPDWAQPGHVILHNVEAELPLAPFAPALEHFGIATTAIEWPENIHLRGYADINAKTRQPVGGQLHLSIPKLVRTPTKVGALAGKDVTIGIEADVHLSTPPGGEPNFCADVDVSQETGRFQGQITGDMQGRLRVTGHNTIRADVIDALIDLSDAHEIIRDFRFNDASRNIVSDIDVDIDLTDAAGGVRVDSFCKAELFDIAYMLGGIENKPDGTERVRTDLGKDPFTYCTNASCTVLVHLVDGCTAADGTKVPNECTITLGNALLEYDNTPWLRRQGFAGGTKTTKLTGDSVIIDIEQGFVEINNIAGTVYPAYSFGMFYPELQDFMSDVLMYSPAQVETEQCVFPIYKDCTRPMGGTIRAVCAAESGFRFIGTTIPLGNFSGFICLTDDYVQLDRLNATCWEGVINAVVNIGFSGRHTTFDGMATAGGMNLKSIAAAYGNEQNDALCDGSIRFRASSPGLKDIEAYGHINIRNGDLLTLRVFHPVGDLISDIPGYFSKLEKAASKAVGATEGTNVISWVFDSTGKAVNNVSNKLDSWSNNIPFANHILAYNLREAYSRFSIGNGHLVTHGMKAKGSNLKINANLDLDLDSMTLRGDMWPHISSLPTIVISPITFLSKYVIDIKIDGPVDDLKWSFGLDGRFQDTEPPATAE